MDTNNSHSNVKLLQNVIAIIILAIIIMRVCDLMPGLF